MVDDRAPSAVKGTRWPRGPIRLVLIATFLNAIGYQVFIPIMPIFLTHRGATPFVVGLASSLTYLSFGLWQYPGGWLADHFDRRRFVAAATLAYSLFFIAYLFPIPLTPLILIRFVHAGVGGLFMPGALALLADFAPPGAVSRTFGYWQVATMGGALAGPLAGGFLASWGLELVFAAAGVTCFLAAFPLLRLPPPPHQQRSAAAPLPVAPRSTWARLFPAIVVASAPEYLAGMVTAIWSLYLVSRGAATWQIGISFTLFALPAVVGSVWLGNLIDRRGAKLVMAISLIGAGIVAPTYALIASVPLLMLLFTVEGIFTAAERPAIYSEVSYRFEARQRARAQGVLQMSLIGIGTGGALVGGSLFSISPLAAFATITAVCAISLVGIPFLTSSRDANKSQRREMPISDQS